ncbi:helix-turn-helix domain-containing protein [Aliarcobacter cibarius]|uniref:Bacteriophage CI repressor n=1 Tax=Aliarcobacter cibarius TaxID=255507 RepID=A0ABY2V7F9_9BACT|nr:helix-turn-helix domain-containing protein [Aliarcobacter cibarius]TLS99926.1 bacteriophage CI repressor [Aliarcobacter cibarius]TLT00335.1 bacteriophage CI repressor [Aliarcobacter cibarius]
MISKFDQLNSKMKFIFGLKTDKQVAETLELNISTYKNKKKDNEIPYDNVIRICKDKNIDLNWILNLKNN